MPQIAPITLKGGEATPVNHVYTPTGIAAATGVATFSERVSGVPIGYPTLTSSLRVPSRTVLNYKSVTRLAIPAVVTGTDASGKAFTSVDHSNFADLALLLDQKSTEEERKNLRVQLSNYLLSDHAIATIDKLESSY